MPADSWVGLVVAAFGVVAAAVTAWATWAGRRPRPADSPGGGDAARPGAEAGA